MSFHDRCSRRVRDPCILGVGQKWGLNQNWLPRPYLLGGPQVGGNATSPLHSRGSPNKGGQNQNLLPHPCLLGPPEDLSVYTILYPFATSSAIRSCTPCSTPGPAYLRRFGCGSASPCQLRVPIFRSCVKHFVCVCHHALRPVFVRTSPCRGCTPVSRSCSSDCVKPLHWSFCSPG